MLAIHRACVGLLLIVATSAAAPSKDTTAVCNALYAAYPHQLVYDPLGSLGSKTLSNATLYSTTRTDYWNGHNGDNRAACAFYPGDAKAVAFAVTKLNQYPSVGFALKSGGHNANLGFSSVNGGVLISFRPNLASTVVSADRQTADVGPGSKWDEAVTECGKYGKAVVGGRLGHVGVGGYTLGGGLSFLTSQYGFAAENVMSYELVLANATIVNVNRQSHPDLFFALKGGGNAYGIVTKFTMRTYSVGQVWGGIRAYSMSSHAAILSAVTNFTRNFHDPKAGIIATFDFAGPVNLVDVAVVFFFYDGTKPPSGIFDEFNAIPSISDSVKVQSYASLLKANNIASLSGFNYQIREATYPNMPLANMTSFLNYHFNTMQSFAAKSSLSNLLDFQVFSFALQPIPVALSAASNAAPDGPNALGLDPLHGDRIFMEYDVSWVNPACDNTCPGFIKTVVDKIQAYEARVYAGVKPTNYKSGDVDFISHNPIFMNDGMHDQKVLESYGDVNYQKLKAVAQSVDPTGFFANRQGGFKFTK